MRFFSFIILLFVLAGCSIPDNVNDFCRKLHVTHLNYTLISLNENFATLNADLSFTADTDFIADVTILVDNKVLIKLNELTVKKGSNFQSVSFTIHEPRFWWVNNLGDPYLYSIAMQIKTHHKICFYHEKKFAVRDFSIKNDTLSNREVSIALNKVLITPKIAYLKSIPSDFQDAKCIKYYLTRIKESNFNCVIISDSLTRNNILINDLCDSLGLLNISTKYSANFTDKFKPSVSLNFQNKSTDPNFIKYNELFLKNYFRVNNDIDKKNQLFSIKDSISKYFKAPENIGTFIYYSQILQASLLKSYVEKERVENASFFFSIHSNKLDSNLPEGYIFSPNNLTNPAYTIFAPALNTNSVIPVDAGDKIEIYIINDNPEIFECILLCKLTDFYGKSYFVKQIPVSVNGNCKNRILSFEKAYLFKNISPQNSVFYAQVSQPGQVISQNLLYFDSPKNLNLPKANITVDINEFSKGFNLLIKSDVQLKNMLLVSSDEKIKFPENNFDLFPNKKIKISVMYNGSKENFQKSLKIYTLNPSEITYK